MLMMASKRRNMFYHNKKQEKTRTQKRVFKTRKRVNKMEANPIMKNIKKLSACTQDVDTTLEAILKHGVFDQYITYEILKENSERERKRTMYELVANGGPGSLAKLCSCFLEVRLSSMAIRLDPSLNFLTKTQERDENRDREIILQNLEYLIDGTEDLNLVLQKLVNKRMLDEKIRAEIEDNDADERKKKLYLLLAKCGPSAAINLQECFKEMGWNVLQDVLGKSDSLTPHNPLTIRKAKKRMDLNYQKVYRMSSSPMGVALVINIDIETCEEEKRGMEMDVNNIINLWKALGYKVVIRKDLTKRQFEYEVKAFSCMTELNEVDSMAIILMTHGPKPDDADGIFACDKGIIRYEWIVKQFEVPNCSQLMGKPKLFFLYSCSGKEGITPKRERHTTWRTLISDTLVIRSTIPGCFLSSDSANYGSCMMEGICEVFKHHAHEEHIETMMKFVNKFLQFQGEEISNDNILTFENRGFNKDLYFNPGLQD